MLNFVINIAEYYLSLLLFCGTCYCIYKVCKCNFFCISPDERVECIILKHDLTNKSKSADRGRRVNKAIAELDMLIDKSKHPYAKRVYRKARLCLLLNK